MEKEYKPERANVPTKHTLIFLSKAYQKLKTNLELEYPENQSDYVAGLLEIARDKAIDQREVDDIKSVYDLLDQPEKAMARIAEILTCDGRIYDDYSEFLKGGKG